MIERVFVGLLALALSVLSLALVGTTRSWQGHTLLGFGDGHGIDTGDLPVVAIWVVGMGACTVLWRRAGGR